MKSLKEMEKSVDDISGKLIGYLVWVLLGLIAVLFVTHIIKVVV